MFRLDILTIYVLIAITKRTSSSSSHLEQRDLDMILLTICPFCVKQQSLVQCIKNSDRPSNVSYDWLIKHTMSL